MLLNEDLFDDVVDIEVPEVVEIETVEKIPAETPLLETRELKREMIFVVLSTNIKIIITPPQRPIMMAISGFTCLTIKAVIAVAKPTPIILKISTITP